ncbi:hypothetical protein Tco_1178059 [Tanacetum coccineum]
MHPSDRGYAKVDPTMAAVVQNTNNTTIRSILLAEKLSGLNFTNWYRNLRIVLRYKKKINFVEQPTRLAHDPETANSDNVDKYYETVNLKQEVSCLMLSSMSPDLQRTLDKYNAYDMLKELKIMFEEQAKHELFKTVTAFHAYKQEEGQSVSSYLLNMKSYLDTLECLSYAMPNELGTIAELHAMLKLHEKGIPKKAVTLAMLAIREGKIQKDKKKPRGAKGKDKGKNKLAYDPKPKNPSPPKGDNPAKDSVCHHYKEVSHWRRNYTSYQAMLKKRKNASVASTLESRKLKHGALSLYMGNGMRAAVEAIGSFDLILLSGLIIVLDNCHFAPSVTRDVVLISCLVNNGYIHTFTNYGISVSKDNVFYFNAIPRDGYPKETMGYYFYYPLENKIFVARNVEFFENSLMVQEASGSHGLLEAIHNEVAPIEVDPRNVEVPIRRSERIPQAPDRYGFYVDVEEYELGDLNEPPNYKATLSYLKFDKWPESMNTKIQSMKDNQVWVLVDLPSNGQTVRSKWLFKKKTDMDGNQASRSWNKRFDVEIKKIGLTQNLDEPCVYLKASGSNVAFLILLRRSSTHPWNQDLRDRSKRLIALSQSAYLEKILNKFWMENFKKGYTLMIEKPGYRMSQGAKTPSEVQRMQRVPYASAIGSIMYAIRSILKYLRNTKDMVLVYGSKPEAELKVSCYADAIFQTDKDDTKSQTGYVFVLNGGAVDWKSAKQSATAMSSTEAEYIAAAEASMEAVWIRKLIDGLGGVVPSNKRPMEMLCDNEPAIAMANVL